MHSGGDGSELTHDRQRVLVQLLVNDEAFLIGPEDVTERARRPFPVGARERTYVARSGGATHERHNLAPTSVA